MEKLGLEFKVGLFTLAGLACTGYLFIALSPGLFSNKDTVEYVTFLKNAGGIVPKSHVKTNGVSIGKVKSVNLGTNNTRVVLEVDKSVKIPSTSKLTIKSVGLLGDSHIEILRSVDEGTYFGQGDFIPESTEGSDISGLIDIVGSIASDIKQITKNLAGSLGGDKGQQTIDEIVENVREIAESAKDIFSGNRDDLRILVKNIKLASETLKDVLDNENREKFDRIIDSFDKSMAEVESATHSIRSISEKIDTGKGTLGRLVNDDEAMTELEGAIKDIRKVLAPATQLQVGVDARLEVRSDESSQTYFNMVFKTRPDKYYIVGFTDTQDDIVSEQITDTTDEDCVDDPDDENDEPCDSARRTVTQKKDALKLNVQFAKRWDGFGLRFGLFESTGGFATDFFLLSDKLRFSIEAFEWKTTQNEIRRVAHIKAYMSILFYDHIYVLAGIDDPTKYKIARDTSTLQKPNWYFGAGVTFNDDDLKTLFGAAALTSAL